MTDRQKYPGIQPFYVSQFSDGELTAVYQSGKLWLDAAPALSVEIGTAINEEIERRFWNTTEPDAPKEATPLALRFCRWSDRDIGDGLRLVTVLSYVASHALFGELIDYLAAVLSEVAGERLAASGDPRNGIHFVERLQAEETKRNDPETN